MSILDGSERGWPWNQAMEPVIADQQGTYPRISIVMPSYNQARFIEGAIRSVICQRYPNTELVIIDGGSTDGTIEILRRYEPWIAYWISESDRGQAEALNKGYRRSTGDLIGWQNTDDFYGAGSFFACARAASEAPDAAIYHGRTWMVDSNADVIREIPSGPLDLRVAAELFLATGLPNQSAFIRRIALGAGPYVDENYMYAMDTELALRLVLGGCKIKYVDGISGYYRIHADAKTSAVSSNSLVEACRLYLKTLERPDLPPYMREPILKAVRTFIIALFRKGDAANFRTYAKQYLVAGGMGSVDLDLHARIMFSLVGTQSLTRLMRWVDRIAEA